MLVSLGKRAVSEFAGTATLCLFGLGGAVAAFVADAGGASLVLIAAAWAIGLTVAIYGFGPVSGAHLNPTVSLVLALRGRFPLREVPVYVAAQLAGATVAAALVYGLYGQVALDAGLGASRLGDGVSQWQGVLAEAIAGFVLVLAICVLAVQPSHDAHLAGVGIGITLGAVILAIGPVAGASINLARTFGPEAVLSLADGLGSWSGLWIYLVAPVVGGLAAAVLHDFLRDSSTTGSNDPPVKVAELGL